MSLEPKWVCYCLTIESQKAPITYFYFVLINSKLGLFLKSIDLASIFNKLNPFYLVLHMIFGLSILYGDGNHDHIIYK